MTFSIDLARPPSKNASHGFGRGRVFRSKAYVLWLEESNKRLLASGQNKGREPIDGKFDVSILYREGMKGDPQNWIDVCCDWLQHAGVVANDKNLRCLELKPAKLPLDCRLIVEPV